MHLSITLYEESSQYLEEEEEEDEEEEKQRSDWIGMVSLYRYLVYILYIVFGCFKNYP
jgi:hypothetical protein